MSWPAQPIPVPATSIYIRADGVVAWRAYLEQEGEQRENVEVNTTHIGLGFHAPALLVIADRLAQPPGTWKPFHPGPLIAPWFPRRGRSALEAGMNAGSHASVATNCQQRWVGQGCRNIAQRSSYARPGR